MVLPVVVDLDGDGYRALTAALWLGDDGCRALTAALWLGDDGYRTLTAALWLDGGYDSRPQGLDKLRVVVETRGQE